MLGPTTCAVENRGIVDGERLRIAHRPASARSRRVTNHASSAGTHDTGSRREAARARVGIALELCDRDCGAERKRAVAYRSLDCIADATHGRVDLADGDDRDRPPAADRRRMGRDRRVGRGALALRRLARCPGREGRRRRDATRDRRGRARDGVAAPGSQAGRDPRSRRRRARAPGRRGGPADLRRGRASRSRPRASRSARAMSTYTMAAVAGANARPARWCRWTPRRQARASSRSRCGGRSGSSARSRRSTSRSTSSRTRSRLRSPPVAPWCSSPRRRHPCRRSSSRSWRTRRACRPGWLNVVVGPSSEIGDVLVEDERVKLITFTGSGAVGWGIRERARRRRSASSSETRLR